MPEFLVEKDAEWFPLTRSIRQASEFEESTANVAGVMES